MRKLNYSFQYKVPNTLEYVVEQLSAHVNNGVVPHWLSGKGVFRGSVTPDGFKLRRRIKYRNSMLPALVGRFEPTDGGTMVHVDVQFSPLNWVFIGMFLLLSPVWLIVPASAFGLPVWAGAPLALLFAIQPIAILGVAHSYEKAKTETTFSQVFIREMGGYEV